MHKVKFLTPGSFMPEESAYEIPERTVAAAMAIAPASAFAFTFYDVADDVPDLGPDFHVTAVAQNKSARYYIDGETFTLDEVEGWGDEFRILASNMRGNRWPVIVKCRTGNFQPLQDGDEVVSSASASSPR